MHYQPVDLLAPARRAGVLMFILGGLGVLVGVCLSAILLTVPMEQLLSQPGVTIPEPPPELGMSKAQFVKMAAVTWTVVVAVVSVALVVLGFFVRSGRGRAAPVTAAVLTGLVLAVLLLNVVTSLAGAAVGGPAAILGACMVIAMAAPFVVLMVWLIQAVRAAPRAAAMRQRFQAQYWHAHQQQLAYAQPPPGYGPAGGGYGYGGYGLPPSPPQAPGGYGYGAVPPPPQSPPLPPAPGQSSNLPTSSDSRGGSPRWDVPRTDESKPADRDEAPPPPGIG